MKKRSGGKFLDKYKRRERLWNEVEKVERSKNSRLAREITVALPIELDEKKQKELLKEYVQETFVDNGMVADVAIHRDNSQNPHAHIMLTVRSFKENGEWDSKARTEYILDENGNKTRTKNGNFRQRKISTTNWNDKETMQYWRKNWARKVNQSLELNGNSERITEKSYAEQGIKKKPTVRWLFLTLTVKNVYDGEELNKSLSDMAQGFRRMMQYKKINKNLVGFMRATEVTINNKDNSYNQHMHVLVCVEPTYFKNTENYVNQKQWIQFWKKAMKLDYDPNVKVQMIRPKNKYKSDIQSAIDETAKYPVKDTDFMTDDEEKNLKRLSDLEEGLHRKRLISYGGLLKEIHKKLNLDDTEEGDLIHTDDDEKADEDGFSIIAMWNWERKNYFIKE
ncbi:TPA: protein rep [Staphylococcus aureus]|nr:protein rep [Staphylococcus aureus]CAY33083.1 putative plasmid replication protein [Staphylococcus aureus subsp. aureus ST398]HBI1409757.1 protein rep [Staphylococcus aureus]HBI1410075.1 protein rep [Staphylococcus aureus]HBI1434949.1 protein rep [Staphylococcus aureus]HBI1435187.1 protein rep [Staphylococcus aureus]